MSFVGAGPGAADLITLRGATRIAEADLVLYTPSTVDPVWLREHARADAELVDHGRLGADELAERYRGVASRHHRAVLLIAGDPAQCADLREQRELCTKIGLDVEVVPGVSPVSAVAAATGNSLTEAAAADTAIVTDAATEADFERIRDLAAEGRTLAVNAPAARAAELAEALTAAGLDPQVPVVVAHKVSWADEKLLRTTVGEVVAEVKRANLWRHALFLVGDALRQAKPRAGYVPRAAGEPGKRWASKSWRSTGTWPRRSCPEAEVPAQADVEPAVPEQARPVVAEADVPAVEAKPVVKRTAAAKKQPPKTARATARRTTKK
ncbi:precorrin-4/cobalt-precorrin-4 C11-methyltransferase [Actinokineospora baliensis]|uniref:cobalt-precorrin-4/precorrin-4 C(11)-methyltransferase n=1 Tax=Actinokineospora baliensis TaxID=547056 RepID=UPI00195B29EA|nr:cobalt-precorrin-4/precorrin-4 C(11)-methyltransferase [Actinokineospora baliensis]MBM7772892.1 precorrin-4/cobalt-precorrin-4 C11-methyltransferase [Actinokineospora baliensis]